MPRLLAVLLAGGLLVAAEEADAVLARIAAAIPSDERGPGQGARAAAIVRELERGDCAAGTARVLHTALAEAWLEAGEPVRAQAVAAAAVADPLADQALRERAGLAWLAAWEAVEGEDPEAFAAAVPGAPVRLRAAAAVALGRRQLAAGQAAPAGAAFERALVLLASGEPDERVPVYALRLLAFEAQGADDATMRSWLAAHAADPAVVQATGAAVPVHGLIGQEAAALVAPRQDGGHGGVDLAAWRGQPVLVYFFATWSRPCAELAPRLVGLARHRGDRLHLVGVSLDTPDTLAAIPAFCIAHGIIWPVIGEGLGWDGELDDAYRIEAIPALVLVDAQGRVVATDLAGPDAEATIAACEQALAALDAPASRPASTPAIRRELLP